MQTANQLNREMTLYAKILAEYHNFLKTADDDIKCGAVSGKNLAHQNDVFLGMLLIQRGAIVTAKGYVADCIVSKEINLETGSSSIAPSRLEELINRRLHKLFPNGSSLSLVKLEGENKYELNVFTDKRIILQVIAAINLQRALKGKITPFEFLPIDPINQRICGLYSAEEVNEFIETERSKIPKPDVNGYDM
jgi:hypothetical protein